LVNILSINKQLLVFKLGTPTIIRSILLIKFGFA